MKVEEVSKRADQKSITVLYPGGFKPMTGGHLNLIERYSNNDLVKEVKVLIGPGIRNGINQDLAYDIALNLTSHFENVKVEKSKYPSPILTAYKTIEEATPGVYALGASSKDDDYKRVKDFTNQHQIDGKYSDKVPEGVHVKELIADVNPLLFNREDKYNNKPISASVLRNDILNSDKLQFYSGYPASTQTQKDFVWSKLIDIVSDSENTKNPIKKSIVPKLNKHMSHVEDLVVSSGSDGLEWVSMMFNELYDKIQGNNNMDSLSLSVKIDGAPAIFAWSKFNGLPDYSIAMKGLFAKTPVVFSSAIEIEEKFNDRPDLVYKLTNFLKYTRNINIPIKEIWQGDFLFDDKSISILNTTNNKYYSFHPNTILYTSPIESVFGKLIDNSKIGIAWHTRYTGSSLDNVSANYNATIDKLNPVDDVFMIDTYIQSFNGIDSFTNEESKKIKKVLQFISKTQKKFNKNKNYSHVIGNKDIIKIFSIYQNSLIKDDKTINDVSNYLCEFIEFIEKRSLDAVTKLKTQKGKDKTILKFNTFISDINNHKEVWEDIINLINQITDLKELFINKLNNINIFQTFLKNRNDELISTDHEGFAISDTIGNVVKLISRSKFSYNNFNPDIKKGWEDEMLRKN